MQACIAIAMAVMIGGQPSPIELKMVAWHLTADQI